MKRGTPTTQGTAALHARMARLVALWRQSLASKAAFARAHGLSRVVFSQWCRRCAGVKPLVRRGQRPLFLHTQGGIVRIDAHDEYYRRTLKILRQQVRDCHPDRRWQTKMGRTGGNGGQIRLVKFVEHPDATGPFLQAQKQLAKWLAQEVAWYATYGLRPPGKAIVLTATTRPRRRGHVLDGLDETPAVTA